MRTRPTLAVLALAAPLALSLGACSTVKEAVHGPQLAPVGYPSALAPMDPRILARDTPQPASANSLWRVGARTFFHDQRASKVGDILTVLININDQAKLSNETVKTRNNSENTGIANAMGFETQLQRVLPHAANPASLINATTASKADGLGSIARQDQVTVEMAMLVTQVLPNGNLVVVGHQEMRVNYDIRDLQITGVIRPQDISSTNTIALDKIAEARVSYGGRGQLMDAQQPRYGQQLLDIVSPF